MYPKSKAVPVKGSLLVSEPFMSDPYFKRTVVLLAEHNEEGTVGFILNKPINVNMQQAISEFPKYKGQVFMGGPVGKDNLFFVHTLGDSLEGSMEIGDGLYWGGNFELLKVLIRNKQVSEHEVRFFIGYAGWEPRQLDKEMKENSWIVTTATKGIVMGNPTDLWKAVLRKMGTDYSMVANFPEDPQLN